MLMTLISLAISLISIHGAYSLPAQDADVNQSDRVRQERKDTAPPVAPTTGHTTPSLTTLALPRGDNAWAIQIDSTGGLTGSGRGDLTVASDGLLTWSAADGACSRKLSDETMQALTTIVLAADASAAGNEASVSILCGDCYVTTMILQRRGTAGAIRRSSARWDEVSQAKVSAGMSTVYETLTALKGCKF